LSDETIAVSLTRYYLLEGLLLETEDVDAEEFDAILDAAGRNLEDRYRGEARQFGVELESLDDESRYAEVILSFTWHAPEEDEAVVEEILERCQEELEVNAGFQTEEVTFLGVL